MTDLAGKASKAGTVSTGAVGSAIGAVGSAIGASGDATLAITGDGSNLADHRLLKLLNDSELILAGDSGIGYRLAELMAATNPSGWSGMIKVKHPAGVTTVRGNTASVVDTEFIREKNQGRSWFMAQAAEKVELKAETLLAYTTHIAGAEAAVEARLRGEEQLPDGCAERIAQLRKGATIVELCSGKRPLQVPDGLIHDWNGLICVPGTTVEKTLALLQNYDNHKNIYQPEVIGSKLIGRQGNDFQIYLRLRKKKFITVILDTDHDVHYSCVNSTRWACHSRTTRISEVEDAGKPTEKVRPPDTGYGFLWRLHSYWRIDESENCTFVECRAISLTRDVPSALAWIIEPIILKLPRDSLKATLEATRRALTLPAAQV